VSKKSELEKIFKNKNRVDSTLNYYKPWVGNISIDTNFL
jgi:hypothetical protein